MKLAHKLACVVIVAFVFMLSISHREPVEISSSDSIEPNYIYAPRAVLKSNGVALSEDGTPWEGKILTGQLNSVEEAQKLYYGRKNSRLIQIDPTGNYELYVGDARLLTEYNDFWMTIYDENSE